MKPANGGTLVDREQGPVGSVVQGDGQALECVLSPYSPALYRTALRQLRNPEDAEDAVQDALLSAFKHIAQFEGRSQISTWLTRIVLNSAGIQLRRRPRHKILSLDQTYKDENLVLLEQLVDTGPGPEELCEQAELHEIVNQVLNQLSPTLRSAFQLRELDGLSTREAAQVLGVTESALKSNILRARAKLSLLLREVLRAPQSSAHRNSTRAPRRDAPINDLCGGVNQSRTDRGRGRDGRSKTYRGYQTKLTKLLHESRL